MSLPHVYLVDASVYMFRAWFSISDDFANEAGEPTNAVYGYTGFLVSLLEQTDAEHVGVAFDESLTSSFRNGIYPEYKANRDPAPEELKRQFAWAREVTESLGLACYADPLFEADDLIGTLASYWTQRGHPVCVVTADKDLAQLVGDGDHWWDFARNQRHDATGVRNKWGVSPAQIADFLALTGDSVDNIPGVPGVGAKTAAALLDHFGDLDTLWERLDEVPGVKIRGAKSIHQRLVEHREAAELARRLTGIQCEVPSALESPDLSRRAVDEARLNRVFDELSFGPMLRQRCLQIG